MKKIFVFILIYFFSCLLKAQEVKIEGFIKQPLNEFLRGSIVINDTINKLAKLDSTNHLRRDKIFKEQKYTTSADDK